MGALAGLAPIVSTIGTGISVLGTIQAGREAKAQAEYQARVQEQQADEAYASSQRDAAEKYRKGQIMLGDQRAAIAASGGDLTDPSVLDIMGDTQAEIDLAARTDIFRGDQQARGYNDAAINSRISGQNAKRASYLKAGADLFSNVSSMYSRFGANQPKTATKQVKLPYG